MITWRDYDADSGKAITSWIYDAQRGFLTQKKYDDGNGPSYTRTPAGRLLTREWVRGITTSYQTNAAGEVVGISYDDGITPAVSYYLDRQGRRTNIVDGSGSRILTYSLSGRLLSETNTSGTLVGIGSAHAYDEFQRRTNLAARSASGLLLSQRYAFDDASRLTNAAQGDFSAAYSYLANSSLIEEVTYRSNSTAHDQFTQPRLSWAIARDQRPARWLGRQTAPLPLHLQPGQSTRATRGSRRRVLGLPV